MFFRLHHAMPAADRDAWFAPIPSAANATAASGRTAAKAPDEAAGFMIYPGHSKRVLGHDILLEDTLDPGRHGGNIRPRAP